MDLNSIENYETENVENNPGFFTNLYDSFSTFEKKGKYLDEVISKDLYNFVTKFEYLQYKFFNRINDTNDPILNSLNNYMEKDLKTFCQNKQKNFIHILHDNNKNILKKIKFNSSFELDENAKFIYFEKIKKKLNELATNKEISDIEYITILVAGKSRVGKSTLINELHREDFAKTDEAQVCTKKPQLHSNEYFRMIDTRGIQLIEQFKIENIFKKLEEIYIKPEEVVSDSFFPFNLFNTISYRDNIQCIWYCISEYNIEKK